MTLVSSALAPSSTESSKTAAAGLPGRPRRAIVAIFVGCVLALSAPASALADDVSIGASADPVEDVTYQISVAGTSSDKTVYATLKATGGRPCGANPDADDGDEVVEEFASGQFSFVRNRTTYDSGTYLLCAWVDDSSSGTPTATAEKVITVRAPRSSGSITAPAKVAPGATFQVAVTAQTEVGRYLFVDINSPGVACGANYEANSGWAAVLEQYNTGGPFTYTRNVTAPTDAPGLYGVCGYVQESSSDAVAEATFAGGFVVDSGRCGSARKARSRYRRRVGRLERKLERARSRARRRRYRRELRTAKRKLAKAKRNVRRYCS